MIRDDLAANIQNASSRRYDHVGPFPHRGFGPRVVINFLYWVISGMQADDPSREGQEPVTSQDLPPGELPGNAPPERDEAPSFDITRAHPARVYDYWLGGCFL